MTVDDDNGSIESADGDAPAIVLDGAARALEGELLVSRAAQGELGRESFDGDAQRPAPSFGRLDDDLSSYETHLFDLH